MFTKLFTCAVKIVKRLKGAASLFSSPPVRDGRSEMGGSIRGLGVVDLASIDAMQYGSVWRLDLPPPRTPPNVGLVCFVIDEFSGP